MKLLKYTPKVNNMEKTKLKMSVVREIEKETPQQLKGQNIDALFKYGEKIRIGYAQRTNANWVFFVYVVKYHDQIIPIVTVGQIIQ